MIYEQNNFPCKCGHPQERHGEIEQNYGEYCWHDDLKENVWVETSYPRSICSSCNNDCNFAPMTNLEYLEWKHEQNKFSKH